MNASEKREPPDWRSGDPAGYSEATELSRNSEIALKAQVRNEYGVLRSVLERARCEAGCSLSDLTALSGQNACPLSEEAEGR
jgi:hypothetical protein